MDANTLLYPSANSYDRRVELVVYAPLHWNSL